MTSAFYRLHTILSPWYMMCLVNQEKMIKQNIADTTDKIKSILNMWQGRVLTLKGRIFTLKSLVLITFYSFFIYILLLCEHC